MFINNLVVLRNQERAQELERENEQVRQMIEMYKQQELEEKQAHREKIRQYGDDLTQQMQYQNQQKNIVIIDFFYTFF